MSQSRSGQFYKVGLVSALAIGGALALCGNDALAQMRSVDYTLDLTKIQLADAVIDKESKTFSQVIPKENMVMDCAMCPPFLCCP